METNPKRNIVVIGAGAFGSWTAYHLHQARQKVTLLDAYGPSNDRSSSGGESRIIRMGYGADEIYTRLAMRSLTLWKEFSARVDESLFHPTGVLWVAHENDPNARATLATLKKLGVNHTQMTRAELDRAYPQFSLGAAAWAIFEPESGALMARRAIQTLVAEMLKQGVEYSRGAVTAPTGRGRLDYVRTTSGETYRADEFVFACGPWLPKIFPGRLGHRIFPTRQEVFFFGTPAGDFRFCPPALPTWIDVGNLIYGFPDLENRGLKVALDSHGPAFDPDRGERWVPPESVEAMRKTVGQLFPALQDAPLLETRVCQYENTSNGDFLVDRHPDFTNVWLLGGGSGHGFKHSPALGEYVASRILEGGAVDPRFSLATKGTEQKRAVY
jgi:monomeric sarcosine oxidase